MRNAADDQQFMLATLPPSRRQIRLALGVVTILVVAFAVTAPFASTPLRPVYAFVPAFETAILVNDLITSALLFAQYVIVRRWALLVLASGYLFTALIVIPHALTFPGLFAPAGLLGAGLQSTVWLYIFWHAGSPMVLIVYALFKDADGAAPGESRLQPGTAVGWSVTVVFALVCAMTWVATTGESFLPRIFLDNIHVNQTTSLISSAVTFSLGATALVLLWIRRRSVLDLWLMVVCCAWMLEVAVGAILINGRFDLGWYAGRLFGLSATLFILLVLLSETTALYARLVQSIMRQQSDREGRQTAADAMSASIAHEIKQPLAAIVANAEVTVYLLTKLKVGSPDLDEARTALNDIVEDGHRAAEMIANVRTMFKKDVHRRAWLSVNELVREVLAMVDVDLRMQGISVSTELREGLPQLLVDRGQLQQVFLNLIMNAIEAMRSVADRVRLLRITSHVILESSGVLVTVEDSGTGIAKHSKDRIFERFFSTKSTGTGLGLTICRSIIESHGGSIQVSSNNPHGTIFMVALPLVA
jgi:signal transduction histidine kinase